MFVGSRFLKYIGSFTRCSRLCTCENVDTDSLEGSEFKLSRTLVFSCPYLRLKQCGTFS